MSKLTIEREKILTTLHTILNKSGVTSVFLFSKPVQEGEGDFDKDIPGLWIKVKPLAFPGQMEAGSRKTARTLEQVAAQINKLCEHRNGTVARAIKIYSDEELEPVHNPAIQHKNVLIVDAAYFSQPKGLDALELIAKQFRLNSAFKTR